MTQKPHYPILDGLRGTAALLVVTFHLLEAYYPVYSNHPIHHGYLAVDFFFMLSGFVIGYAYDDRWATMKVKDFFKIRLIRLQPLVVLASIIGAICFYFDPYTNGMLHISFTKLMLGALLGAAMMPAPDLRGWNETHSLNGPCWSLAQEYIANILYAFFGKKITKNILWIIVVISAAALIYFAVWHKDVASGWAYNQFHHAFVRMMFPFFGGLLLYRIGKLIKIPLAYLVCSLLLVLLFCLPTFAYNGLYESACIIFIFPIIIAAGAGSNINGKWAKLCKFSGEISYPIYILHYPVIYVFTAWVSVTKPSSEKIIPIAIGLFIFLILFAYLALKLFDEPLRAWLRCKWVK